MTEKVDFRKILKNLYNPGKGSFQLIEVPAMNFLMIDGKGDPNTAVEYKQAVEALYSMSYGIKFALKPQGVDYIVPPMEGLWWMEDMNEFTMANKPRWEWTMMIMQPEWVSGSIFEKVRDRTYKKKVNPALQKIKFECYQEGLCVQILYIGAYSNEASTIADMHGYIKSNGYKTNGKHHEIYLGDPRKSAPDKLQTILRQPICKESTC
jgi:hypothetical protein